MLAPGDTILILQNPDLLRNIEDEQQFRYKKFFCFRMPSFYKQA